MIFRELRQKPNFHGRGSARGNLLNLCFQSFLVFFILDYFGLFLLFSLSHFRGLASGVKARPKGAAGWQAAPGPTGDPERDANDGVAGIAHGEPPDAEEQDGPRLPAEAEGGEADDDRRAALRGLFVFFFRSVFDAPYLQC